MAKEQDQMNVVSVFAIVVVLLLVVCSARAVVNPDGGLCRFPVTARMFKMCVR